MTVAGGSPSVRELHLGQRLRRAVGWSLLFTACGAVLALFLAPFSFLNAYSYGRSDGLMLLAVPAFVGFGFGFLRWPDASSRNRQDPPRLSRPPSSSDPFYRVGRNGGAS